MYFSLKSLYGFFFGFFLTSFLKDRTGEIENFLFRKFCWVLILCMRNCSFFGNRFCLFWNQIWDKVFKNGPSKICGTMPLKHLKGYGLLEADHNPSDSLKTVFHKFYLIHSWILCPICSSKWQYLPDNARCIFLT